MIDNVEKSLHFHGFRNLDGQFSAPMSIMGLGEIDNG
jgi:hypothetical protein